MNILLTAIGSASALSVARQLKKEGYGVYGTDIFPSEWLYGADEFIKAYKAPLAYSDEYVFAMLDIAKSNNIDILVPLTDPECDVLSKQKELFSKHNIIIACLDEEINSLCRNKLLTQNRLKTIVNTIDTYSVEEAHNLNFPMIAKPIDGRSSEGLKVLQSLSELEQIKNSKRNYILQKYIEGSIYTVDCVRDKFGNCVCLARKELLRTVNGLGTAVEFYDKKTAEADAEAIMCELNIVGCVNIEFIESSGKFYILEINPRFSGGVGFSIMRAYDFANASIFAYLGKRIDSNIEYKHAVLKQGYEKQQYIGEC